MSAPMNAPFPAHLVHGVDDDTKKLANDFWTELNKLARTNPAKYHEKIAQVMKEAADHENEQQPRSSRDFILHVFSIQTASTLGNRPFRINVLQSHGIKDMVGNEVPMLVSRVRAERKASNAFVCDIIVNPTVVAKAKKDVQFQADLQELMFESVREASGHKLDKKQYKLTKSYVGQWLWRDDGTQLTDEELETVADMTVESMLSKLHLARSNADTVESTVTEQEPISLVLPGQGIRRLDSKATLIEEVGGEDEAASPTLSPIVDLGTLVPTMPATYQERQKESRPAIVELLASKPEAASRARDPAPSQPLAPLLTPMEPTQLPTAPMTGDNRPLEQVSTETAKFLANCPAGAYRRAYTPIATDTNSRMIQFDLSVILPPSASWAYSAELDNTNNVLDLEPDDPTLPWLSVRFFKLGAQLMVGPRVVHPITAWLGGPLPQRIEPKFSKKSRTLTVTVSKR